VIATQSHPLRVSLRAVPGVPIVHLNRAVMILEPASDATLREKHRVRHANHFAQNPSFTHRCDLQAEQDALAPSTSESAILNAATPQVERVPKKKRGPKGPNPLSVKKKTQKHSVQKPKANVATTARDEQVEARGKRKLDESDSNDETSSPKPKRRRRRKSQARPQL
jgi:U3 small nucleolar RNA-associated protein 23